MSLNRSCVFLAALTLSLIVHAGCGKKGHLVMPDSSRPAPTAGKQVPATEKEESGPSLPSAPATP